jgi:hypothetical protein
MIRFREFITEIFDRPSPFKVVKIVDWGTLVSYEYRADIDGRHLKVSLSRNSDSPKKRQFADLDKSKNMVKRDPYFHCLIDVDGGDGENNMGRVVATIIAILRDVKKRRTSAGDEEIRVMLLARNRPQTKIVDRVSKMLKASNARGQSRGASTNVLTL